MGLMDWIFMIIIYFIYYSYLILPLLMAVFFTISLNRYLKAKKKSKLAPDLFPIREINKRLIVLIIASVLFFLSILYFVGVAILQTISISFM